MNVSANGLTSRSLARITAAALGRRRWAVFLLALCLTTCGGSNPAAPPSPTPAPTSTPPPAMLNDLSASVTSVDAGHQLNCREDVHAQVTLANHGEGAALVTGVRKTAQALSDGCRPAPDFTYAITPRRVGPNSTTVVMNRALYSNGSGCCDDPNACSGGCELQETFEVITNVGSVPAGHFAYELRFSNCDPCQMAGVSSSRACPPTSR